MQRKTSLKFHLPVLILIIIVSFSFLKVYRQAQHYRLDSFVYKHIYFQIKGNTFEDAKKKAFEDKKVVFNDETAGRILNNEEVYKKLYSMFPKRPFYPYAAYFLNSVSGNETLAFALPVYAGYVGFVLAFYFICKQILEKKLAFLSALAVAFYNPLLMSAVTFMPDTIAASLWMLTVIFVFKFITQGALKWLVLFIVFEMIGLTVREQSLLVLPFALTVVLVIPNAPRRGKQAFKRSKKIFLLAVLFVLFYHLVLLVFGQRTFVDTILYLQSGYGLHEQAFSLFSILRFYLSSLLEAHMIFGQVLLTHPIRLAISILAIFGIRKAIFDKKNIIINSVMFASGIASYSAIFAYPVPNPRYFFSAVGTICYFAAYFLFRQKFRLSKVNWRLTVFLGILALFEFAGGMRLFDESSRLEKQLAGVDLEKFESAGAADPIRLAAFYQWNKEDPLFGTASTDVDALRKSIKQLISQQDSLLQFIKNSNHVYPTDFLLSMADALEANQKFLKNPSQTLAYELLEKQENAAILYKAEAQNLIKPIEAAKFYSPILMNITTNKNIAIADLKVISKNGDALINEIEDRKRCLEKGDCKRPAYSFQKPKNKTFDDPSLNLLDKDLIFWNEALEKINGPYGAETLCYGWGNNFSFPTRFFYINELQNPRNGIGPFSDVRLADDVFFEKVTENTNLYFKKKLWELKIPYAVFSSTAAYRCPNLGFISQVLTIDDFLRKNKPILANLGKKFNYEGQAEADFFSRKYPTYQEALQLSSVYGFLYRRAIQGDTRLHPVSDELLRRKLEIERQVGFESVLSYVTWYIKVTKDYEIIELKSGSKHASEVLYPEFAQNIVYPLRPYYSIMYLPFSKSVWRLSENLQFAERKKITGLVGFDNVLLNYQTAVSRFPKEQIKSWLINRELLLYDCEVKNICN